jgi:hypothetical protein
MLLIKIVLVIFSLQKLIAAGGVTCDKNNTKYRTKYRSYLEKGGEVFMAVSYSSIKQENSSQLSFITEKIERDFSLIKKPIVFVTSGKSTFISVTAASAVFEQSGFGLILEYNWKNISFLGQGKVNIFASVNYELNQTEIVLFHACQILSQLKGKFKVEKSILVLILGKLRAYEEEITQKIASTPVNMTAFKFDEFEDQDYDICEHLIFYLNECVVNESEIWVVHIEMVICIAFVVVVAVCLVKLFSSTSSDIEPSQAEPNQAEPNQAEPNPVEPNQAGVARIAWDELA